MRRPLLAGLLGGVLGVSGISHESFASVYPGDTVSHAGIELDSGHVNLGTTERSWVKQPQTSCKQHAGNYSVDPTAVITAGGERQERPCRTEEACLAVKQITGGCTAKTLEAEDCKICAAAYSWKALTVARACSDKAGFLDAKGFTCDKWATATACKNAGTDFEYTEKQVRDLLNNCPASCGICREGDFRCQYMDRCSATDASQIIDLYEFEEEVLNAVPNAPFVPRATSPQACPNSCSGHGKCVAADEGKTFKASYPKKCVCDDGYAGEDCSKDACPGHCSGNGYCDHKATPPECKCRLGFEGEDCTQTIPEGAFRISVLQNAYDGKNKAEPPQYKLHPDGLRVVKPTPYDPNAKAKADAAILGAQ